MDNLFLLFKELIPMWPFEVESNYAVLFSRIHLVAPTDFQRPAVISALWETPAL